LNPGSTLANENTDDTIGDLNIEEIETISRVSGTSRCVNSSSNSSSQPATEHEDISTFFSTHIDQDNALEGNRLDEDGSDL
jgi:hypothetical protein